MKQGLLLGMAAFAALPAFGAEPAERPAAMPVAPAQHKDVAKAIVRLEKGDWKKARKTLAKRLKKQPDDAVAAILLNQIDRDPKTLLGTNSFAYLSTPGDTYQSLAKRYLGDGLMFYALARYNGVSVPGPLAAGSMLRIPGTAVRVAEPRPGPSKSDRQAKAVAKPANAPATKPSVAAAKTAKPASRPQSSAQMAAVLRRQGLSALSQGKPGVAVAYLERAAVADPASKPVAADLARAKRVRDAIRR